MSEEILTELEKSIRSLKNIGDDAAIERATSITKTIAEIRETQAKTEKARIEAMTAPVQLRVTRLQVVSSIAVPIVSMLTVFATVFIQTEQLKQSQSQAELQRLAAEEALEEAKWTQFLGSLKGSPESMYAEPTFLPRLREFSQSKRLRERAVDVAKRIMPELSTAASFRDLYELAFPEVNSKNINDVAEVSRRLGTLIKKNTNECANYSNGINIPPNAGAGGLCSNRLPDDAFNKLVENLPSKERIVERRKYSSELIAMSVIPSQSIRNFLATLPLEGRDKGPVLNLSGVVLNTSNFDDINFSNVNLAGATFARTTLRNAVIKSTEGFPAISETAWWEAKEIEQNLLIVLITSYFPFSYEYANYPEGAGVSKEFYSKKVALLCTSKRPECTPSCLRFKTERPSDPSCVSNAKR